jgi:hypothetical protein
MLRRLIRRCTHEGQIRDVEPSGDGCKVCLQMGDTWVHLRECLTCGQVGCCDNSVSLRRRNALSFRVTLSPGGLLDLSLATWREAPHP